MKCPNCPQNIICNGTNIIKYHTMELRLSKSVLIPKWNPEHIQENILAAKKWSATIYVEVSRTTALKAHALQMSLSHFHTAFS